MGKAIYVDIVNGLLVVTSLASASIIVLLMCYAFIITLIGRKALLRDSRNVSELPEVSVLIAVKDEYEVLRYTLENLLRVDYPLDRLKVYVGVDGECSKCFEVCNYFKPYVTSVKVSSKGKAGVLNELIRFVSSDYVLLLDCDSVVHRDSIRRLVGAVVNYGLCGATGIPRPSNLSYGLLPKFFLVECILWLKLTLAKDYLGLIVQGPGYFTLLKRSCIDLVGGWDEGLLAEDNDLTLRIYGLGGRIGLVGTEVLIQTPIKVTSLIKQRIRWYRGTLEVLKRRWDLIKDLKLRLKVDALATFISPISPALLLIVIIVNALLGGMYNLITAALIIPQVITPLIINTRELSLSTKAKLALLTIPYVLTNSIASVVAVVTLLLGVRIRWWRTEKIPPQHTVSTFHVD